MRISFIGGQGNYMDYFHKELRLLRHEVLVNECDKDCDVILCENRNQWQMARDFTTKYPHISLICWNWDWYDYLKEDGKFISTGMFGDANNYVEFNKLIKESLELWSVSPETGEKCEKDLGIKSKFFYKYFLLPHEWEDKKRDFGYIVQGSRLDPNKRFDWFERAAEELSIPFKSCHPPSSTLKDEGTSRPNYIRSISNCSFNVLASREESGGGTSTIEASYCHKPVLTSDNGGAKFFWEDDIWYFKKDDFQDFKRMMWWLWENYDSPEVKEKTERAYQRVNRMFFPEHFAKRISDRLEEVIFNKNCSKGYSKCINCGLC